MLNMVGDEVIDIEWVVGGQVGDVEWVVGWAMLNGW